MGFGPRLGGTCSCRAAYVSREAAIVNPVNAALRKLRPLLVLSVGFGGLILFILAAAVGTIVQLDRVRGDETRIRQDFLGRLRTLEQIRSVIYLSGTDMRDFLLSNGAGGGAAQRGDILAIQKQTKTALDQYARTLEPDERDTFLALRSEIDAWWQVLQTAFQWTPEERNRLRITFFYEQLVPRRTTMLQIADRIAEINERGLNRAEERLSASAENLRWSLLVTFGIALLGGVVLALGNDRSDAASGTRSGAAAQGNHRSALGPAGTLGTAGPRSGGGTPHACARVA